MGRNNDQAFRKHQISLGQELQKADSCSTSLQDTVSVHLVPTRQALCKVRGLRPVRLKVTSVSVLTIKTKLSQEKIEEAIILISA